MKKKLSKIPIFYFVVCGVFILGNFQLAKAANKVHLIPGTVNLISGNSPCKDQGSKTCYEFLEPLPAVDDKGRDALATAVQITPDEGIGASFNNMYMIAIGIGSVLAVIMIMVYGFRYMTNDKSVQNTTMLRERLTNVALGLLLLLGIYVILNTINPQLVDVQPEIGETFINSQEFKDIYQQYIVRTGQKVSFSDFGKSLKSEYIPALDKVVPSHKKGIRTLMLTHTTMEGFYPGSKAYRTNNPGNIGNVDSGATVTYPTLEAGVKKQYEHITNIVSGKNPYYKIGTYYKSVGFTYDGSLDQYLKIYATGARVSSTYLNMFIAVFKKQGFTVTGSTKMSEIFAM